MFGQKRIPSREGGVEIVVEELCTRMVAQGHNVTCYNRGGHHVSGCNQWYRINKHSNVAVDTAKSYVPYSFVDKTLVYNGTNKKTKILDEKLLIVKIPMFFIK